MLSYKQLPLRIHVKRLSRDYGVDKDKLICDLDKSSPPPSCKCSSLAGIGRARIEEAEGHSTSPLQETLLTGGRGSEAVSGIAGICSQALRWGTQAPFHYSRSGSGEGKDAHLEGRTLRITNCVRHTVRKPEGQTGL